jgi:hypothetical protein
MVDINDFSEVYTDCSNVINNFANIEAICEQAFYRYRFNLNVVKKLNKYLETIKKNKNSLSEELEKIQVSFDTIETLAIIFLHNYEKVQAELLQLTEPDKQVEPVKPVKQDDNQRINELISFIDKTVIKEC